MESEANKVIVLSGIRATGALHMGNYLGAIRYFVKLQNTPNHQCFYFVANLHTLTTFTEPEHLREHLRDIILDFIACGIDPAISTLYAQSSVPEISELNWLLSCLTPADKLLKMTHYAEKREQLEKKAQIVSAGLLFYPVLMAADILGPCANLVPVGQDQHAHVELAREIARRFNHQYQVNFFPEPKTSGSGLRVPSLGIAGKMGKSESAESDVINLRDTEEQVVQKFRVAVTDTARMTKKDPGTPENCNIWAYHVMLSDLFDNFSEREWAHDGCVNATIGCVECKMAVAARVNALLAPIRSARVELDKMPPDFYLQILRDGAARARLRFRETVEKVKEIMGVPTY